MTTRFRAFQRLRHLALAAGLLAAPSAFAGGDEARYTFHWSVTTDENELHHRSKIDWAQRVDFHGAPIRKDLYFFYGQFLGLYPRYGLHQTYMHPGGLEAHLRQARLDIEARIAPDFDGYVCIDWENWNILWERQQNQPSDLGPDDYDFDFKDDWIEHVVKPQNPNWASLSQADFEELCRSTYNEKAKEFFLETLRLCTAMRPKAKWGMFEYPNTYNKVGEVPPGEIGYPPDGKGFASKRNDTIQWLFDAQGALFPAPYCVAVTQPEGVPADWAQGTDTFSDSRRFIQNNVREAVRLAKGKPVISFMWAHYWTPGRGTKHMDILNDINARHVFELPMTVGAQGVAIWDSINWASDFPTVQNYMRDQISPMIIKIAQEHGLTDPYITSGKQWAAGGWLPPPTKVDEGFLNKNAHVPDKPPTGTGGWVPPKGGNNNTGTASGGGGGGGGGPSTVKQPQKPYKVVVGSTGATQTGQAGSSDGKAGSKSSSSQSQITPAQRKAAVEAIRRVTNKVSQPVKVADVPTSK